MEEQTIDKDKEEKPTEKALLVAFEQNWLHARHQESQRFWLFNIYLLTVVGIISLTLDKVMVNGNFIESDFTIAITVMVTFFLFVFSLSVFLVLVKLNLEFGNHIRAIQWISEELELIKKIKIEEEFDKKIRFKGFIALPLPLPIKAHKVFSAYLLFLTAIIYAFLIYSILFYAKFLNEEINSMLIIIGFFTIIIFIICCRILNENKEKSDSILKGRKPENLKIYE